MEVSELKYVLNAFTCFFQSKNIRGYICKAKKGREIKGLFLFLHYFLITANQIVVNTSIAQ